MIVTERYDRLKMQISPATWEDIRAKAEWEGCTLSAVIYDWPDILPKRLQKLARACFVNTTYELLTARRKELRKELRRVESRLAKLEPTEPAK